MDGTASDNPWGPFEPCPHNPILSHRNHLFNPVQATGHGDLVQDVAGRWWMVFLGIRTLGGMLHGFHTLGRETFLAPVEWDADGWPVVGQAGQVFTEMDAPLPRAHPWPAEPIRDDFDAPALGRPWNFLRNPYPADWSLTDRPGFLRLHGSAIGLDEKDSPAFVGRRQEHFNFRAATEVAFEPAGEHEEAGLTVLANPRSHIDLAVTLRDGRRVVIVRRRHDDIDIEVAQVPLPPGPVRLEVSANAWAYFFAWAGADGTPHPLAKAQSKLLSTEFAGGFTGVYLGLYATGQGQRCHGPADFDWFEYEQLTDPPK